MTTNRENKKTAQTQLNIGVTVALFRLSFINFYESVFFPLVLVFCFAFVFKFIVSWSIGCSSPTKKLPGNPENRGEALDTYLKSCATKEFSNSCKKISNIVEYFAIYAIKCSKKKHRDRNWWVNEADLTISDVILGRKALNQESSRINQLYLAAFLQFFIGITQFRLLGRLGPLLC